MRVLQRLRHRPVGFNMTPMIDVVFLLIIFFLVSSHLAQRENRIRVELPSASSGQPESTDTSPRVTLTLQTGGRLWLAGRRFTKEQLLTRLQQQSTQNANVELRIRCDRRIPYRDVEPVLAQAVAAGIWNVSFAVKEGRSTVP